MAVAPMKKVHVIAHRRDQAVITNILQGAGLIEVVAREPSPVDARFCAARIEQISAELTKVNFVLDFLHRFQEEKTGVIAGLIKERFLVASQEFHDIAARFDFPSFYQQCSEAAGRLDDLERRRLALIVESDKLRGWTEVDAPLRLLRSTERVGIALGRIRGGQGDRLREAVRKACKEVEIVTVSESGRTERVLILYYRFHHVLVERALAASGFEGVDFGDMTETPANERDRIGREIDALGARIDALKKTAAAMREARREVIIMGEWLRSRRDRYENEAKLEHTEATLVLEGWVDASKSREVVGALGAAEVVVDFSVDDPRPNDNVPIVLKNPRRMRPFETLTRLYGVPNQHELDPTPIMGVSFIIFFGLAFGDFGYGLILILFCLILKKRLLLSDAGRDWLDLFAMGGVSTMIVGVLTGTYFGIAPETLPAALRSVILLDTLMQAFPFLVFTWVLGVLHISAALIMELWDSLRSGRYADAFMNDLPQITVFFFGVMLATGWIGTTVFQSKEPIYELLTTAGLAGLGWSCLAYVFLSGGALAEFVKLGPKSEERFSALSVLGAVGGGLYNLYGMSAMIGDILSYSRLMALGLATLLIAFVINTLAGLLAGISMFGLPIGFLLAILVAVPLHIANIVINLLGAFVHPLRLQFVEFFSKFYENGGRAFKPLSISQDKLIFDSPHKLTSKRSG